MGMVEERILLGNLRPDFRPRPASAAEGLHLAKSQLGSVAPADYFHFLQSSDGGEGLVGDSYLTVYSVAEAEELNRAYAVSDFCPSVYIIGSNGGGEALAIDLDASTPTLLWLPFIPLSREHAELAGHSLGELFQKLVSVPFDHSARVAEASLGCEVHQVKPIAFGGDPSSPKNRALVPRRQHAELCVYWNRLYRRMQS